MLSWYEGERRCSLQLLAAHLGVEDELLLVEMQQRQRVGLGVVDEDLQAGIQRRALAVGAAREHALKHLLRS